MRDRFCQSCGMDMKKSEDFGTHADLTVQGEYSSEDRMNKTLTRKKWLRAIAAGAISLILTLPLTACGQKEAASSAPVSFDGTESIPPLIDVDLATLLSVEEVSDAIGREAEAPEVYELGTLVQYLSLDRTIAVNIQLESCTPEVFDVTVHTLYSDLIDAPNLGDIAYWSGENRQLVLYGRGYMIGVNVDITDGREEDQLAQSRQLAGLILEKLPS